MVDFTDNLKCAPQSDGSVILAKERDGSLLHVDEVSQHLFKHDGFLERQQHVLEVLMKEPIMKKTGQLDLSRPDRYKLGLARAKVLRRLSNKHGWSSDDDKMAGYLIDEVSPYFLHSNMFAVCVREQGSEEQKKLWMSRIDQYKIIGAYAQTELGHGSNVKGLEVEARYDIKTKEFVLHSPYLTSSKWWNGSLGRTANHAIVVAQLLLPAKGVAKEPYVSLGPHTFVVQIRDLETHKPLNGVIIGDIGPKYGYWSMDNGYMLFDKFRVPHSALLSRYTQVDPETGHYHAPSHPEVLFGTMTFVRAQIIMLAGLALGRVATVATRYTAIRRQFFDRDLPRSAQSQEMVVLDYQTVQRRVFPLIATAFALQYTAIDMSKSYWRNREKVEAGDFSELAYLHSNSSGLKSLCTTLAADGIETGRRALGGHGFGGGSGLIALNNDYMSKVTVEGDNYMITQQVASYVIKRVDKVLGENTSSAADDIDRILKEYLHSGPPPAEIANNINFLDDNQAILQFFERRLAFYAFKTYEARVTHKKTWNTLLIQFHKLSNAQSQAILVKNFYTTLADNKDLSSYTTSVLWDLYRLFAYTTIESEAGDFIGAGILSGEHMTLLADRISAVMLRIRPHAVKLVDAWKIPDYLLDSALGRYDGKVYEDLFHRAHRQNSLNKVIFNPNYWEDELVKESGDKGIHGDILAKL